jgi:hypothetical protein
MRSSSMPTFASVGRRLSAPFAAVARRMSREANPVNPMLEVFAEEEELQNPLVDWEVINQAFLNPLRELSESSLVEAGAHPSKPASRPTSTISAGPDEDFSPPVSPTKAAASPRSPTPTPRVPANARRTNSSDSSAVGIEEPQRVVCVGWVWHPTTTAMIDAVKREAHRNRVCQDTAARYFHMYFDGREHRMFAGSMSTVRDGEKPLLVTTVSESERRQTRALIWSHTGVRQVVIPHLGIFKFGFTTSRSLLTSLAELFAEPEDRFLADGIRGATEVPRARLERVQPQLRRIEDDHYKYFTKREIKVGVMYVKRGQRQELEMLSNSEPSPGFLKFLKLLGHKVRLKGFQSFSGGLDTRGDLTGEFSVFSKWQDYEVMFHVSTMLPCDQTDKQFVQRKRHLGNDVCLLIYSENERGTFVPSIVRSHFTHVVITVYPTDVEASETRTDGSMMYTIDVATQESVPYFGPDLEFSTFVWGQDMRDAILSKVVNGQQAALQAPGLFVPMCNYRTSILRNVIAEVSGGGSGSSGSGGA